VLVDIRRELLARLKAGKSTSGASRTRRREFFRKVFDGAARTRAAAHCRSSGRTFKHIASINPSARLETDAALLTCVGPGVGRNASCAAARLASQLNPIGMRSTWRPHSAAAARGARETILATLNLAQNLEQPRVIAAGSRGKVIATREHNLSKLVIAATRAPSMAWQVRAPEARVAGADIDLIEIGRSTSRSTAT